MSNPTNKQNEKNTAAWKLFNCMFSCTVRALDTYSTDYLELRGTVTQQNSLKDRQAASAIIYREMTINTMLELFRSGAKISVLDPADTKKIYDIIAEHLEDWKEYLNTRLNTGDAPLDDLVELDRFATVVYKHAKSHFTKEIAATFFKNNLANLIQTNIKDKLFSEPANASDKPSESQIPDERESLAYAFKSHIKGSTNGGRKWS